MKVYQDLIVKVLEEGYAVPSVQGVGCLRLTHTPTIEFNFSDGHPVVTTRSLRGSLRAITEELLWIISGSCWLQDLHRRGVHFWDKWDHPLTRVKPEWHRPEGYLGPIYGHMFRNFGATRLEDGTYANDGFDQLAWLVQNLQDNPYDRRNRTITWDPKVAKHQFIACCWGDFHFLKEKEGLWINNKQRSCDLLVGGAFDLITHSILFEMIGRHSGHKILGFDWKIDDCCIYLNQIAVLLDLLYPTGKLDDWGDEIMEIDDQVIRWAETPGRTLEKLYSFEGKLPADQQIGNRLKNYLEREPRPRPRIELHPQVNNIFDFGTEDVLLVSHGPHHPPIKDIPVLI